MGYEKNNNMGLCDFGYCDEGEDGVLGAAPRLRRGMSARTARAVRPTATIRVSIRPADVGPARPTTIQMFIKRGHMWLGGPAQMLERLPPGSYVSDHPPEMLGTKTFTVPLGSEVKFKISGECNGATYSRTTGTYTARHASWNIQMPGASCPLRRMSLPRLRRR